MTDLATKLDARVRKSRAAIMEAGRAALLLNSAASLSDVARQAGVGRATLYRHFSTREALIRELARESVDATDRLLEPIVVEGLKGREAIEATVRAMAPLADQFHFLLSLWSVAGDDPEVTAIYERQLSQLAGLVVEAQQEGSVDNSLSVTWIVNTVDALLYASWCMVREGHSSAEEAAELVLRTLFNGIR